MVAVQNPTRIWPKPIVHVYESESRGREGTVYRVLAWHGVYECDCPARVECKHIKQQRAADMADHAFLEDIRAMNTIEERGLVPASHNLPDVYQPSQRLGTALVTSDQFAIMKDIAATVMKGGAGMVPDSITTPEAALAVMLAGHEMGVPPFRALDLMFPVNGRMKMMTELYIALVRHRDPTARFIFHTVTFEGADVELFRGGVSEIRVTYTDPERIRAHQGYRKRGSWEDYQWQGKARRRFKGLKDADGKQIWDEDEESPWTTHRTDMFVWAAVKRCIRFGASDLINLTPREIPLLPEDELVPSSFSKAVFGAGTAAAGAFADDDEGPLEGGDWRDIDDDAPPPDDAPPIDEDPQQAPVSASAGAVTDAAMPTPAAASPGDEPEGTDVPMPLADIRETLEKWLLEMKDTWGKDFPPLQAEMGRFNPDGKGIFNPRSVPESKAAEALAFLKTKRGDA